MRESPESRDQAEGLAELMEVSLIEERKVNDLRIEALERIKASKTEIGRILKNYGLSREVAFWKGSILRQKTF